MPHAWIRPLKVHCQDCPCKGRATLCSIGPELLQKLDEAKTVQAYPAGTPIFLQGNKPQGLYALISGKVKIHKIGRGGRSQIVRLTGPGELFGYRALLAEQSYCASAEALEDSQVCLVDAGFFRSLLTNSKDLANIFFKKLSLELGKAEDKLLSFAQSTVRQRLAEVLTDLQQRFGAADGTLQIQLTRAEIAELAGTTPESTIRTLAEFQRKGWIKQEQRQAMHILNAAALRKLAQRADDPEARTQVSQASGFPAVQSSGFAR
jgi:CRP/FNR family transcriptional regulator